MVFGKQIDEHETSKIANNQQIEIQEVMNTNEETMTRITKNQTNDVNDATPPSRISQTSLQTWGITHTYDAPHPLKAHLFPQDHRLQLLDIIRGKQQNITCDLTLNLTRILTSDDLTP